MVENVPGAGRLLLGEGEAALPWLGAMAVPLTLGVLGTPPLIRQDFRGYFVINPQRPLIDPGPSSLFSNIAVKLSWLDVYHTYQRARIRTSNATFMSPVNSRAMADILRAPFLAENLSDWRVWATVGAGIGTRWIGYWLVPDPTPEENPDAPSGNIEGKEEAPPAISARSARIGGLEVPAGVGLTIDMLSVPILAYFPALGEEPLFRGVVQEEFEHALGPAGGLGVMSAGFGAIHLRPGSWQLNVRKFLLPFTAELLLGALYQSSNYDITKPMAARFWFDTIDFARDFWRPDPGGVSVIGITYSY
jgi:hypothetical protein